jgi:large subunit ribosomal protein L22
VVEVRAVAKYIGLSPYKVRLVADTVRGKGVDEALDMLMFTTRGAAKPLAKVIRSATANAEENYGLSRSDLYVARITADEGPRMKRRRFGARGHFKPILRRYTHITVVLDERGVMK